MTERDQKFELLKKTVDALAEHYDAIQIVASWLDTDGGTSFQYAGSGNHFARISMCEHFIADAADQCENAAHNPGEE